MGYKEVTLDEVPENLKNTPEYKSVIDELNERGCFKSFDLDDYAVYINENGEFKKSSKGYVIYDLIW